MNANRIFDGSIFIFCILFHNILIYFKSFIGVSIGIDLRLSSCSTLIFVNDDRMIWSLLDLASILLARLHCRLLL
jgi:small basic protein